MSMVKNWWVKTNYGVGEGVNFIQNFKILIFSNHLSIEGNVKIFIFVRMEVSLGRGQPEAVPNVEEDIRKSGLFVRVLKFDWKKIFVSFFQIYLNTNQDTRSEIWLKENICFIFSTLFLFYSCLEIIRFKDNNFRNFVICKLIKIICLCLLVFMINQILKRQNCIEFQIKLFHLNNKSKAVKYLNFKPNFNSFNSNFNLIY